MDPKSAFVERLDEYIKMARGETDPDELKKEDGDTFITNVLKEEQIMLRGDESDL